MPEALYSIMGIFSKSNFKIPAGHKTAFLFSPPRLYWYYKTFDGNNTKLTPQRLLWCRK